MPTRWAGVLGTFGPFLKLHLGYRLAFTPFRWETWSKDMDGFETQCELSDESTCSLELTSIAQARRWVSVSHGTHR